MILFVGTCACTRVSQTVADMYCTVLNVQYTYSAWDCEVEKEKKRRKKRYYVSWLSKCSLVIGPSLASLSANKHPTSLVTESGVN